MESLTPSRLARYFDHTLLKADATTADIEKLCGEALRYEFHSVCVNGCWVRLAKKRTTGSDVKVVAVVGFPLGAMTTTSKVFETQQAIKDGADEIDMVLPVGAIIAGDADAALEDIRQVVLATGGAPVKVILETGFLNESQIGLACRVAQQAGAAFVKTSTGFGPRGASREDVLQMSRTISAPMEIKASGGIRTLAQTLELIVCGASRIGASAGIAILEEFKKARGLPSDSASTAAGSY